MAEWPRVPLSSVARIYDGPHATAKKVAQGPWYLNIASLQSGRLVLAESYHISESDFPRWTRRVEPRAGDLLFSYETRIGDAALMSGGIRACLGRRMGLLRPTRGSIEPRFLLYAYLSPEFQETLRRQTIFGATVERLPISEMGQWEIPLPPPSEQSAIAEVLGALDDKIEANSRLVESAHGLASTYGRRRVLECAGRLTALEDVVDTCRGVSYRSVDLVPGGGWLVSLKCAGRDGSFQPEGLKPFSGPAKSMQVVDDGDVVVAQTDLTQRAEVIGRPVRIERLGRSGRLVASLDFSIVRPKMGLTREFLFALLSQPEFREHVLAYCNGTTVLHMNSHAIPSYQFAMPDETVVRDVTLVLGSLLEAADAARNESMALGDLRGTLLPRLLSGALRVRDARAQVEDAV